MGKEGGSEGEREEGVPELALSLSGSPYNTLDVGSFQRASQRPNGSPTEAVLQDFITRGFTVDDLFVMLSGMRHVEGMRLLLDHGEQGSGVGS